MRQITRHSGRTSFLGRKVNFSFLSRARPWGSRASEFLKPEKPELDLTPLISILSIKAFNFILISIPKKRVIFSSKIQLAQALTPPPPPPHLRAYTLLKMRSCLNVPSEAIMAPCSNPWLQWEVITPAPGVFF